MSNSQDSTLSLPEALQLLQLFSCKETKPVESEAEKIQLRHALLLLKDEADHLNLGVCADNSDQGDLALFSYLRGLGYEIPVERDRIPSRADPVYLKFNSQTKSYYAEGYTGEYRGVLISCQSFVNDEVNGTYGYLPLDLFA
jgi:hypothetical protein